MKEHINKVTGSSRTDNPLFQYLGIIAEHISPKKAILRLPIKYEFNQDAGVVAGGILATIADEAMAHVVLANLSENQSIATIEMNIRYLRSIKEGEIRAEGRIIKKGRRIITVAAEVRDKKNFLLAHAGASFIIIESK
jgi:uncharacterized protein (TIGR00369 family)